MALTRRSFIRNTCAATAGGLLTPVWARAQVTLGSLQIDTLSDGNLVLPGAMTIGQMPAEAAEIVARYGLPTDQFTPDCNVTLLRDGTNTVLFDVGAGPNFMPTAGKLLEALETLVLDRGLRLVKLPECLRVNVRHALLFRHSCH
ncbi:MAG: twin-arginine translocation signal domain-containing protein [Rhodobacteraceae bacterium]|nr:twin-arginine translocation signal domain-containing protein [Paracoccaceae bacterium]